MSLIADGLLIVTCLTTAIYCYVLSRRLQRLSNTDEGIGQQIAQFNAALEETRSASGDLKAEAQRASDRLIKEVAAARKVSAKLQAQIEAAKTVKPAAYEAGPPEAAEPASATPVTPVAAAAVAQHVEDLVEPVEEPGPQTLAELPEEAFDEDDGDVDLDEFDDLTGEQQLGFLPDVDIGLDDDDLDDDDLPAQLEADDEAQGASARDANDLLKVERMAL